MANITKQKRDQMIAFLEELKKEHSDDASVRAFNEIENHLKDKKFGLVFEEHTEEVDDLLSENIPVFCADIDRRICKDNNKPWNFLIEGDNLQALYLLEKTHLGKVDCIYIDPPYNTGAKDWKYNNDYVDSSDVYRHSKWLSMMKARLMIAKRLLNPKNSILVCTIDEKEYLHLGCLLEELFPEARIQMVDSVINRKGVSHKGGKTGETKKEVITQFSRVSEYIFFVMLGNASVKKNNCNMLDTQMNETSSEGVTESVQWLSMLRRGAASQREDKPKHFYPIFVDPNTATIIDVGEPLELDVDRSTIHVPDGLVAVWPMRTNGTEGRWQLKKETFVKSLENGTAKLGTYNKKQDRWAINYLNEGIKEEIQNGSIKVLGKDEKGALILQRFEDKLVEPKSVWNQTSHNASEYGTTLLNGIIGKRFSYPKSLYAVEDVLRMAVGDKKDAVIVDFFAGSGTTFHATCLLNVEDGGNRKCIIVTNNEVSEAEAKKLTEAGYKKGDVEWDNLGIAKYVTWPRAKCVINGVDINENPLTGIYFGIDRNMSEGFSENIKFFKCDWTPRKPEDYLLSNALCLHIKEMIELQNSIEVDNIKNVLILNKDDIKNTILIPEKYNAIEKIWLNQNIILNHDEMQLLKKKGYKYIPREFFGQELKEAAE